MTTTMKATTSTRTNVTNNNNCNNKKEKIDNKNDFEITSKTTTIKNTNDNERKENIILIRRKNFQENGVHRLTTPENINKCGRKGKFEGTGNVQSNTKNNIN
ncbi:Hypothetical predicted protein [Octopus vulgaris]|uniref:Uncharacterized protein n=1 Tax=Octopus vulgaris TaxID=6645 RepID=A0AA36AUR8_OCTVU|nr:Hypothetical predicted protein [Octopus vulgaris]